MSNNLLKTGIFIAILALFGLTLVGCSGIDTSNAKQTKSTKTSYELNAQDIFDQIINDLLTVVQDIETPAKKKDLDDTLKRIIAQKNKIKGNYSKLSKINVPEKYRSDHRAAIKDLKLILEGIDLAEMGLRRKNKSLAAQGNLLIQNNINDLYKFQLNLSQQTRARSGARPGTAKTIN